MYQPYPTGGADPEPARPTPPPPVVNAVWLMYAGAVISAISLIITLVTVGSLKTAIHNADPSLTATKLHSAEVAAVVVAIVFGLIGIGLWLWMARANKAGKNWARITATVFFGLDTLSWARRGARVGLVLPWPHSPRRGGARRHRRAVAGEHSRSCEEDAAQGFHDCHARQERAELTETVTPSPRIKRSSKSSAIVRAAAPVAIASRFHTFTIAVPTTISLVAPSRCVAITNGSRPKVSGTHNTE